MKKTKIVALNIAFAISSLVIVLFLLQAPEETTAKLPKDDDHIRFYSIKSKKDAEKYCSECHSADGMPLPENHPPKYRCLFCHKRSE